MTGRRWKQAFAEKTAVVGTVTEVIKGGVSVDIGVAPVHARQSRATSFPRASSASTSC